MADYTEVITWFFIGVLVLQIPILILAYATTKVSSSLSFLSLYGALQLIPVGGGFFVGLLVYFGG